MICVKVFLTKARPLVVLLVLAALIPLASQSGSPAMASEASLASKFKEVAQLPLAAPDPYGKHLRDSSGWLIFDVKNRYGYKIFESGLTTLVESFSLDTLKPIRSAEFYGNPITTGIRDVAATGTTARAGEIVHAVDEERGRLYLAMSEISLQGVPRYQLVGSSVDGRRPLHRLVMIDEHKFNSGAPDFAASFREPTRHAPLHFFNVMSLTWSRTHVADDAPGKLLITFGHPEPGLAPAPVRGHTIAQWEVESLPDRVAAGQESRNELDTLPLVDPSAEERVLEACSRGTLGSSSGATEGQLQWELLVSESALWTVCQPSGSGGAVVEVPLAPGGRLTNGAPMRTYPLGKPVADVLVDAQRERLLLRAVEAGQGASGSTVWVFETRGAPRYTGAVALKQMYGVANSLGLDPETGRLYALVPDHSASDARGTIPVRGGIQFTDTRLDPAPPLENVLPEMAYPGVVRIKVDWQRRRVYVRRGHGAIPGRTIYPETEKIEPAPTEDFYRVFEDRIPVAEPPPEIEDGGFTTEVAESDLTRASYLGSGTGYGTRALLVGGLDAAAAQPPFLAASPCGKDDREVLAGSVGQVDLSDLTVSAEAAALDADGRTRRIAPDLVDACRPFQDRPAPATDTEQAGFDEPTGADLDGDGLEDRTGENHYAATCLGDPDKSVDGKPRGFETRPKFAREGFTAEVTCDRPGDNAGGRATGVLRPDVHGMRTGTPQIDDAQSSVVGGANGVQVAYSSSEVTTTRKQGEGIVVTVDSIARGVDIPTVGSIAVVRATATSTAAGRSGQAGGTFTRSICGVRIPGRMVVPGCLEGEQQQAFVNALNTALGVRGRARLREPDAKLAAGSKSGYRAAVQRAEDDLFEDRSITKDLSTAVPALEIMFFQGDGDARWGAGRQILHLAGVGASTSYGITCLYGQLGNGRCAKAGESDGATTVFVPGSTTYETQTVAGETVQVPVAGGRAKESRLKTILYAAPRAVAEAFRLLFNNPRELGLMATVWALLYAPCYLGERRRSIRALRAQRVAIGIGGVA